MPVKLIGTVILLGLVTFFAGFNIDNKCNVNLIFREFQNVPVFFSLMIAFVAGMTVMIQFTIGKKRRQKKSADELKNEKIQEKEALKARKIAEKQEKLKNKIKNKLPESGNGMEEPHLPSDEQKNNPS